MTGPVAGRQAGGFTGTVLRSGLFVAVPETTNTDLASINARPFIATENLGTHQQRPTATGIPAGSAYVYMGDFDGLVLEFLGTDAANEVLTWGAMGVDPIIEDNEVAGWSESIINTGGATLGTLAAGASFAAAVSGIDATDLFADEATLTVDLSAQGQFSTKPSVGAASIVKIVLPTYGHEWVRLGLSTLAGAASGIILARRWRGAPGSLNIR